MKTFAPLPHHALPRRAAQASTAPRAHARGFNLVELMIALTVVALLAVVAIPAYSSYVVRGKRAQAKAALVQAAQYMERVYSQSGCYGFTDANSCANQGAIPPGLVVVVPPTTASDYGVAFLTPIVGTGQAYTLAATPCGAGPVPPCTSGSAFTDPDCGVLTLDNAGAKAALAVSNLTTVTATGATLAAIQQCWNR